MARASLAHGLRDAREVTRFSHISASPLQSVGGASHLSLKQAHNVRDRAVGGKTPYCCRVHALGVFLSHLSYLLTHLLRKEPLLSYVYTHEGVFPAGCLLTLWLA